MSASPSPSVGTGTATDTPQWTAPQPPQGDAQVATSGAPSTVTEPASGQDLAGPRAVNTAAVPQVSGPRTPPPPTAPPVQESTSTQVGGSALAIVGVLLLSLFATMTALGAVMHARGQQMAFAQLRGDLANGTAAVTQLDQDGQLYPLGTPIGLLNIPQIGVQEVLLEGTTSGVLREGPGHRRDTVMPGQAGVSVIYGRRFAFGGPFKHLDQLRPGQVFNVVTGQAAAEASGGEPNKHLFRVVAVRRAGDPTPPPLAAGRSRLTLITATGSSLVPEGLLRVDADLVGEAMPSGRLALTTPNLPTAETALEGDSSAWLPIMLIAQLLLVVVLLTTWLGRRWGARQVWLVGFPVTLATTVALSVQVSRLLPNLM